MDTIKPHKPGRALMQECYADGRIFMFKGGRRDLIEVQG